jgi:serine/threonine protein phosphatase PrpC
MLLHFLLVRSAKHVLKPTGYKRLTNSIAVRYRKQKQARAATVTTVPRVWVGGHIGHGTSAQARRSRRTGTESPSQKPVASSRCFGDLLGKPSGVLTRHTTIRPLNLLDYHVDGEEDVVTDKSTSSSSSSNQFFVVVASDGVVDYMPIQYAGEQVAASFYETNTSASPSLAQKFYSLIQESSGL